MAYLDMAQPGVYQRAIRSSVEITYAVDATLGGVSVATDLRPKGGTITDTIKPGVRRVLNLELAAEPGLFDTLAPIGTELTVTAHVKYTHQETVNIPMGVFVIDSVTLREGPAGGLSIVAPDRWAIMQRARFLWPRQSTPGWSVSDQIVQLMQEVLGTADPINQVDTVGAVVGAQTWADKADEAVLGLAKDAGLWVFFDREGVATVADAPTFSDSADWLIDASASGVLTEVDRERSRTNTHNVVVVSSSAADEEKFATQAAWDNDPLSPTYAGTNPYTNPASAGPFGIVPLFHETSLPLTWQEALTTAKTILHREAGLKSQVSMGSVPNPALDAADTLDVLPPRERYDIPRVIERHIADTVTHPLTHGPAQQIAGRSTRSEEWS